MHSDQPFYPGKPMHDQLGYYMQNAPVAPVFNRVIPTGIIPPMPFRNVDIHPSDACPRNFIIFDQTHNRSQIMFHPEINNSKLLNRPGFDLEQSLFQGSLDHKEQTNDEVNISSPFKENSADIDALMSSEHDEDDESDDEVSTARTNAIYNCSSPDSCSNYEPAPRKTRSLFRKSSVSRGNEKKREKVRKMVKALRGIVPGANRMSSVAVLDEAVRYLKSLRVEVQKLGVGKPMD